MTPRRPSPRYGRPRLHSSRRRHVRLLVAFLAVSAVVTGLLLVAVARWAHTRDASHDYLSSNGWPAVGQGAYHLQGQAPAASPNEHPVPIASVAKVMTAYLVLRHDPLRPGSDGFRLTVTRADVADTESRRAQDQSVVRVFAGERLTERQALMGLLLPSGNNIAVMLARRVAGSVHRFVGWMNDAADRLGMHDTTYTDPSGFDARTVSTAIDQLVLAEQVEHDPVLAKIMATPSYPLPGAGTVHNTDRLLGTEGFVGMKTGSDDAAGGCFMFHVHRRGQGHTVDLVGVVLGQPGHNLIDAALYSARQLAGEVAPI